VKGRASRQNIEGWARRKTAPAPCPVGGAALPGGSAVVDSRRTGRWLCAVSFFTLVVVAEAYSLVAVLWSGGFS